MVITNSTCSAASAVAEAAALAPAAGAATLRWDQVAYRQRVARLQKISRHRRAHMAKADERNFQM